MQIRLIPCIALIATTAFAGWQRQVDSAKGGFTDSPPPHPLAYFLVDPCQRPSTDAIVRALECTWDGAPPPSAAEQERRAQTQTDLREIGKIGQFTIYDLWYSRSGSNSEPDVRAVLAKTAADQYREIDVHIRRGDTFPGSEIITLGGEPLLVVKSHDGGNHDRIDEVLYIFGESGAEQVDFKAVRKAATELIPQNMSIRTATDDFKAMTYVVETYRNDLNLPPVSVTQRARIIVTYRFADGRAVVTGAKFEPYSIE